MRIAFTRLFRIQVRHGWYTDGATREDFDVVPTPSTLTLLAELGLRVRIHADGVTVFGEVLPGTMPPLLRRPLGPVSLRCAFELRARNTRLLNITDLPPYAPARTIFCFDNLREEIASGRNLLGDTVANARIGPSVALVASPAYTYTLGAPAASAAITIADRFGATVATIDARSPDASAPLAGYLMDLAAIPRLVPGRYQISDDQGGSVSIYYDPDLAASRPLAVVEIFTRTDALTPDGTDRVPASYRFLTGDTVTTVAPYVMQFDAVATTWRYLVTKKYPNNGIALSQLAINGPVAFASAVSTTSAIFTSTTAVRLSDAPRGLTLQKQPPPKDLRKLPEPTLTTPLNIVAAVPNFVSDMFVYV